MQKQLLSVIVSVCVIFGALGAQANNPLIRHRDTQVRAQGGTSQADGHYAPVNHRLAKRPEKKTSRYMRNEHMTSPMTNNSSQLTASRLGQQQKYVGAPSKKSGW